MISPRVAAVSFALAAALPAFAASYDGEAPFEKAAETSTVKLGPSDAAPPAEKEIRCFYFSRLMVKDPGVVIVSEGHMGAFEGRAWVPSRLPAGFDVREMP